MPHLGGKRPELFPRPNEQHPDLRALRQFACEHPAGEGHQGGNEKCPNDDEPADADVPASRKPAT